MSRQNNRSFFGGTLVLMLSGLTDVVDGLIARKFNMISDFGKAFDPIADKLTQASVMLSLIALDIDLLFS